MQDEIKIGNDIGEICENFKNYFFKSMKRAQKDAIIDVLFGLYIQDWTRPCEYEHMTGEEVVKKMHETLEKIQKKYGISDYDLRFEPELPFEEEKL